MVRSAALMFALLSLPGCSSAAQSGLRSYSQPVLLESIAHWHARDGALGGEISDYWCDFVIENPEAFLNVMSERRHVFEEWIEALPDLSFTDYGGSVDLEFRRRQMLKSLDGVTNRQLQLTAKPLVDRLKAVKIRAID